MEMLLGCQLEQEQWKQAFPVTLQAILLCKLLRAVLRAAGVTQGVQSEA